MTDPRHQQRERYNGWDYCLLGCFGLITLTWIAILAYIGYLVVSSIRWVYY